MGALTFETGQTDGNTVAGPIGLRPRRSHLDTGIIFGSASASSARGPDSVRATCEAIGLARSTYYYQSHRSASAIALEQQIVLRLHELKQLHPDDGYRRMTVHLRAEGFHVNRKRIARLMQLHCLGKKASRAGYRAASHSDVQARPLALTLREAARATGPYQIWVTDVSYAHLASCLVYAAVVMDAWSLEVVGYAASLQITNRLARIALHSAVRAHRPPPGCIHHSTCQSQVFTRGYCELLEQYGLIPARSDTAIARLFSTTTSSCKIVEVPGYDTWKEVIDHPHEFIQTLYSRTRIEGIVGPESHGIPRGA